MNRIVDTATEHELRAFLKHRKKELRLTDEECLCLRIRRRRLSLERKRPPATLPLPRYCGPGRKQKVVPNTLIYLAAGAASPASAPSPTRASLRLPSSFARCFCCTAR